MAAAARFAGRTAIVTGGSRGIGAGIARVLLREGANVVFCGHTAHATLGRALAAKAPQALLYVEEASDLCKPGACATLVDAAMARYGRVDLVVNNAGWHPPATPIDAFTEASFRSLLDLNLIAPFNLIKAALPHLRTVKGSVVNISSVSGYFGQTGSSTYCATKAGLIGMTKALAIDEAPNGVRINAISPGNVWTELWAEHVEGPGKEEKIAAGNAAQVMGRMGTPEEIGEVVLHLAEAKFTTGVEYLCTGGAELGYGTKA